jgi:hypothetical protein
MFEGNRNLPYVVRMNILISEAKGQLQQARTEKAREFHNKKIQDLNECFGSTSKSFVNGYGRFGPTKRRLAGRG